MATREEYNFCMKPYMTGGGPDRKLRFCVGAKMCSGKAKTEEEARAICSQPKISKQEQCVLDVKSKITAGEMPADSNPWAICQASVGKKTSKKAKKSESCEKSAFRVAECVVAKLTDNQTYKDQAMNINSVGTAVANAILECECPRE